ncbi:MAG: CCA tRNA nucleotidyltransferase [Paludibacteraceae bacterium]|nr:CCA tRNA nucleotidyltransferase [Paludibacteraceae bacterium]
MMNLANKLNDPLFETLQHLADQNELEAYVIGGYVRDLLLERPSKDIDVVVVGDGIRLAEALKETWGKRAHLSVFKNYGTAQVKRGNIEVEFVGARKESYTEDSRNPTVCAGTLQDDQLRRDFTVNALALSLNGNTFGDLLDPFNGLRDLQLKVLRTPCDPDVTFSDDPLRMMRAIRFAAQLGFFIEDKTFNGIIHNAERIRIVSHERILTELNKIMMSPRPSMGIRLLDDAGLLNLILPELTALKGIESIDGIGHKDNLAHSLKVLDNVLDALAESKTDKDSLYLRWAALLHDIGKARVKRFDEKGKWTFHNHDFVGMKMLTPLFRRLGLPMGAELRYVKKLVGMHMRPITLSQEDISDSALRRLLFDAGDDLEDLLTLCEADITSKNADKVRRYLDNYKIVRSRLEDLEARDRVRNFQPPVSGGEIMEMFSLPPCQTVGTLKDAVKDAILDGVIPNEREAALQFVKDKWEELKSTTIKKEE